MSRAKTHGRTDYSCLHEVIWSYGGIDRANAREPEEAKRIPAGHGS